MDFGLATAYYPEEYRYPTHYNRSSGNAPDMTKILQQLHESLDPRTVFACFGKVIGQHLPIQGVTLHYKDYQFSWGRNQGLMINQHLEVGGEAVTLCYRVNSPLMPSQAEIMQQIQGYLLQPLVNATRYSEMAKQAMFDSLTQLGNRHYYNESIRKAIAVAERNQQALSMIVLDLDNFKMLNDRYGHLIGDQVLTAFGQILTNSIRATDQAFRTGGDEFVIIVQGDAQAASVLCDRILAAISSSIQLEKYSVKSSLGLTQWQTNLNADQLYDQADKALYDAKASGRNCYKVAS
ncbi:GGDEF domain-containing protein [Shewanella waksmanii]|uniref:diguanylate cyclase DgcS n=1 Tax=Shewanella waksmanii TaxID=213783 RepID=UPI003736CB68